MHKIIIIYLSIFITFLCCNKNKKKIESREEAIQFIVKAAIVGNKSELSKFFLPEEWVFPKLRQEGESIDSEIKKNIKELRKKHINLCLQLFEGRNIDQIIVNDLGMTRYSDSIIKSINSDPLAEDHGDVEVIYKGKVLETFRVFKFRGKWYGVFPDVKLF